MPSQAPPDDPGGPVVLFTRPEAGSVAARDRLIAAAGRPVAVRIAPVSEIVATDAARDVAGYPTLILTSAAVLDFVDAAPATAPTTAWCVGPQTAAAARRAGFAAVDAGGDAGALVALMTVQRPPGPRLHLRGQASRGDVAGRLTAAGLPTAARIVYARADRPLSPDAKALLAGTRSVILPLYSPGSATALARAAGGIEAPVTAIAISAATARAWRDAGHPMPAVAAAPEGAAMTAAILAAIGTA